MRRFLDYFAGVVFALLASQVAFGQAGPPAADSSRAKKYTYTERMPVFPAREAADSARNTFQRVIHFLNEGLSFPPQAVRDGVTGQVFFSFAVDAQGRTIAIKLKQGLRADVDSAVMRNAYRLAPIQWRPGTQNGRPVSVAFTVPISFNIQVAGQLADSLDLGPYRKLALPLASWSGRATRIPAGKGLVYGSCLQRLRRHSLGEIEVVRLVNLTTHKAVRLIVKPYAKSRLENAFCYALPAGRYALYQHEHPDATWGAYRQHLEELRKPAAGPLAPPAAGLRATRYLFTVEAGQLHYVGTWNLANENDPQSLTEKESLDATLRPAYPALDFGAARLAMPR